MSLISARPILPAQAEQWQELRDAHGKLCARLDVARWLLEIRRSDRDLVAQFDLHLYLDRPPLLCQDDDSP